MTTHTPRPMNPALAAEWKARHRQSRRRDFDKAWASETKHGLWIVRIILPFLSLLAAAFGLVAKLIEKGSRAAARERVAERARRRQEGESAQARQRRRRAEAARRQNERALQITGLLAGGVAGVWGYFAVIEMLVGLGL